MKRSVAASIGGLEVQAKYGLEVPARARAGFKAKFEKQADPDGVLPEEERRRRARLLLRAHMKRLAEMSAEARRRNREEAA